MNEKRMVKLAGRNTQKMPVLYDDNHVPGWVSGQIDTTVGKVYVAPTKLKRGDRIGGCKARWGINRYDYKISPGLYAIGHPDSMSEVLVTANYKLTFDALRKELSGRNLWVVVLDTKGINVWCAAGKGTFGTSEVINRIRKIQLEKVVDHRRIILPQLGASGVAAHIVTKMTGFRVIYGPIYASDVGSFLDAGLQAEAAMRQVRFSLYDRLVLIPVEIVSALKYIPLIYLGWLLLNAGGIPRQGIGSVALTSLMNALPYYIAIMCGTLLVPLLLPVLPFRPFALKGMLLGILLSAFCIIDGGMFAYGGSGMVKVANTLLLTALTSFLALNFTGCTTFTSLSGVKLETKWTTIIAGIASVAGIILLVANAIMGLL